MDDLAEATGLSKGSLSGAFGGRQQLFHRVFDEYCGSVLDATGRQLRDTDEDAYARLSAHLHAAASATAADTARRGCGCLMTKGTAEPAEHHPTVAERTHATVEALHAVLTTTSRPASATATSPRTRTRASRPH
ncbi:hypothetical protein [Actinacidiphila glaucinigra]|uniref:hypothetical protein n=1 Tax=Actinacidiphila glaucinigra TaxID=235986 RepID=UPI0036E00437